MSVVIAARLTAGDLRAAGLLPDGAGGEELDQSTALSLATFDRTVVHWLGTGSGPDRLEEDIARIVGDFDRKVLKERRGKN